MKYHLLTTLLFCSLATYGQHGKAVSVPLYQRREGIIDTSYYVSSKRNLARKLHLENLRNSTATFHFRFWTFDQALDIWTPDSVAYYGFVTSFAQRYNLRLLPKGIREIDTVVFKRTTLSSAETMRLLGLLNRLSIFGIPSDNQIAGWDEGLDGVEYVVETSSKSRYTLKTYWSPHVFQNKLPEAKWLQTLVDSLYGEFKFAEYYHKLQLPPGQYHHNGVEGVHIQVPWPPGYREHKVSIFDWF